jgi:AraC family transcriptional regulator of arabinose operon
MVHDSRSPTHVYRSLGGAGDQGVIGLGRWRKPAGSDARRSRRTHFSAVWCLAGEAIHRDVTGRTSAISPGDLFLRFADEPHDVELGAGWEEAWIALGASFQRAFLEIGLSDPSIRVSRPGLDPSLLEDFERLRTALNEASAAELPGLLCRIQGLLFVLLARPQGDDAIADRACRMLDDDPRCTLDQLARHLEVGSERLRKMFRRRVGCAPAEYRIRRRLDRARSLLLGSETPIQDLAEQLGYSNAFAFTAQFRRHIGHSPRAYRQADRKTSEPEA